MRKEKVLIVDEVHASMAEGLRALGYEVDERFDIPAADIPMALSDLHGLIIRSKTKLTAEVLAFAPDLRFIARAGAGLDLIDLDYCASKNIAVFSANEGNKDAVAEHVMGQLLVLAHKLNTADAEVRDGVWRREANRGWEISGKTIGIIGYGNMGRAFAQRLRGFDVNILAYDKYRPADEHQASLQDIFDQADIVSLHVPLTDETRGMVNEEFLGQFKKPIVLINSSRGPISPLAALLAAMQSGKLKGLALDVLPNEKLSTWTAEEKALFDALKSFPSTVFSPHVAGWTTESYAKINQVLLAKIKAHFSR
jgi:D-3-phosphoglycerate dehydrogenase